MKWIAFIVLAACNDPIYLRENRPLITTGDALSDIAVYVLPVRRPLPSEEMFLQQDQTERKLLHAEPWAQLSDFDIEIEYSLHNLESHEVQAFFKLAGGNEFGDYIPDDFKSADPNAPEPVPLLGDTPFVLEANALAEGVFREDQIAEASVDLEAIVRYPLADVMATPAVVIAHLSSVSRDGLDNVPANDVTPMMVRYRFELDATGQVQADYTLRVRDHSGKLAKPSDPDLYVINVVDLPPPSLRPATP